MPNTKTGPAFGGFYDWLVARDGEPGEIGDLARFAKAKSRTWRRGCATIQDVYRVDPLHIDDREGLPYTRHWNALNLALKEFNPAQYRLDCGRLLGWNPAERLKKERAEDDV